MATLSSSKVGAGVQPRTGFEVIPVFGSYSLSAALALNDVVQLVKVPAYATILGGVLRVTDLDTNGTPAIVLDVGDGGDTDRFIDGTTIGQAGGVMDFHGAAANSAGFLHQYTVEDTIDVLVQAAPATGATSGTIKLLVYYTLQS